MAAKYTFNEITGSAYELFEDGLQLLTFTRKNFREKFEQLACDENRTSNWIGSMLRLFHKKYPLVYHDYNSSSLAKSPFALEADYIENLKARGFRIFKPSVTSDNEMIDFLEKRGFIVEGLKSNNSYHSTPYPKHELDYV